MSLELVVRKMVAHGSMNRPVKGREAQGMRVYVTAISAHGLLETMKFFAVGIMFYLPLDATL